MSISKRAFGVEGFKTEKNKFYTPSTPSSKPIKLTSAKIKTFAPKKIGQFCLIDSYKKGACIYFMYENNNDQRIHVCLLITEIEQSKYPSEFVDIKIKSIVQAKKEA